MRICSPESWDSFLCWAGLGALLASVAPVCPPSLPCSCPGRLALRGGTANSLTTGCRPESREQEVRGREEKEVGCLSPALTSSAGIATPSLSMPSPGSPPWLQPAPPSGQLLRPASLPYPGLLTYTSVRSAFHQAIWGGFGFLLKL